MNEQGWLLLAYSLDKKGGGTPITEKDLQKKELEGTNWVHLNSDYPETKEWLQSQSYLNDYCVEALTAEETRPQITPLENGFIIILRGINMNTRAEPEDMVSLRIYIDSQNVITVRRRKVFAVVDIESKIESNQGPKTTGEFIATLVKFLCNRMEQALADLNDNTDDLEELVLEKPDINLRQSIIDIRKKSIMFKRHIAPQRYIVQRLFLSNEKWIGSKNKQSIHNSYDRLVRYVDDLDATRERTQVVHDELNNSLTDRLNKNTYMLSVIAAVFLPLSFLTGLLGINVAGIPGAENHDAFWIFSGMLLALVVVQILFFKIMKWF